MTAKAWCRDLRSSQASLFVEVLMMMTPNSHILSPRAIPMETNDRIPSFLAKRRCLVSNRFQFAHATLQEADSSLPVCHCMAHQQSQI